jgi:hypothetical protein
MGSFSSDNHDYYAIAIAEHPGAPFEIRVVRPRTDAAGWVEVRATLDPARAAGD